MELPTLLKLLKSLKEADLFKGGITSLRCKEFFEDGSNWLLQKVSLRLHYIMERILQVERMHPYHVRKVQNCSPSDYPRPVHFC
ncbi:unnamed protein product, partial [Brenthis ino]